MENQPTFFLNPAEQAPEDDLTEQNESTIDKKKKKNKLVSVWNKLFEYRDEQPKSEHKSFMSAFESLFSKFTGVEKEEIVEEESQELTEGLANVRIPLLENVEITLEPSDQPESNETQYEADLTKTNSNYINNDVDLIKIDENNAQSYELYANHDRTSTIDLSDSPLFENVVVEGENHFKVEDSKELQIDNLANNTEEIIRNNELDEINRAELLNEGTTEINHPTGYEGYSNEEFIPQRPGVASVGDVAVNELSKSKNQRLHKEIKKLKKENEKHQKLEKQTKGKIKELQGNDQHQQFDLDKLKFHNLKQEQIKRNSVKATGKEYQQISNGQGRDTYIRRSPDTSNHRYEQRINEPNVQPDRIRPSTKAEVDLSEVENTKTIRQEKMPKKDYTPLVLEKPENNSKHFEKGNIEQNKIELTEDNRNGVNKRAKSSYPSNDIPAQSNYMANNSDAKKTTNSPSQSKPFYEKEVYKAAINQGFLAGIIVLVSVGLVIFIWGLVN